jgi:hypothetical protein
MERDLEHSPRRTSYLSEHTVELYLVPRFQRALAIEFQSTLAFYFWASREGLSASRCANCPKQVQLAAVYPRRPKLEPNKTTLFMKVNEQLFLSAAAFRRVGIPVFAGFPQVRSVFDFSADPKFLWFALRGDGAQVDMEVEMSTGVCDLSSSSSLQGPLSDRDVCRQIKQESHLMPWEVAVEAVNHVRQQDPNYRCWPVVHGYKPVYFLAW